ncbi:MAG: LPXTG cell wall anchor domain-containing protein [Defluviitaleaceae bacterium]|nr:LPXTG cell wall anchor domain-containing protein [Defluviitaleaceae bacterium]
MLKKLAVLLLAWVLVLQLLTPVVLTFENEYTAEQREVQALVDEKEDESNLPKDLEEEAAQEAVASIEDVPAYLTEDALSLSIASDGRSSAELDAIFESKVSLLDELKMVSEKRATFESVNNEGKIDFSSADVALVDVERVVETDLTDEAFRLTDTQWDILVELIEANNAVFLIVDEAVEAAYVAIATPGTADALTEDLTALIEMFDLLSDQFFDILDQVELLSFEEIMMNLEANTGALYVLAANFDTALLAVDANEGWTLDQWERLRELSEMNGASYDHVYELLRQALNFIESRAVSGEFIVATDALIETFNTLNEVYLSLLEGAGYLPFEEVVAALEGNTWAFQELAETVVDLLNGDDFEDEAADQSPIDDPESLDFEGWLAAELANMTAIETVGYAFADLFSYLLEVHLLDLVLFDAYWELYETFTDLVVASVDITQGLANGDIAYETAIALLEANTAAILDRLTAINNFFGASDSEGASSASTADETDPDNEAHHDDDRDEPPLPLTGADAANTALAGLALIGVGAVTTLLKKQKK